MSHGSLHLTVSVSLLLALATVNGTFQLSLYGGGDDCQGNVFLAEINDDDPDAAAPEVVGYGPLCSGTYWPMQFEEAQAICNKIGSNVAHFSSTPMFGVTTLRPNVKEFSCGDGGLNQCEYGFLYEDNDNDVVCSAGSVPSIICDICLTGMPRQIRLVGGASPCQGMVLLYNTLGWGFLHGSAMNQHVGDLICKDLGYERASAVYNTSDWLEQADIDDVDLAYTGSYYNAFSFDHVDCSSEHTTFSGCNVSLSDSRIVAPGTIYARLAVTNAMPYAAGVTCEGDFARCGRVFVPHHSTVHTSADPGFSPPETNIGLFTRDSFYLTSLSAPRSYAWVAAPVVAVIVFSAIVVGCVFGCKAARRNKAEKEEAAAHGALKPSTSGHQPPAQSLRQVSPLHPPHTVEQAQLGGGLGVFTGSGIAAGVGIRMWLPGQLGVPTSATQQQSGAATLPSVQPQASANPFATPAASSIPSQSTQSAVAVGQSTIPAGPSPATLPASSASAVPATSAASGAMYAYDPDGAGAGSETKQAEVKGTSNTFDIHL